MQNQDLTTDLKRLKLPGMADNLDRRAREAEEAKLGYLEFAALLIQDEVARLGVVVDVLADRVMGLLRPVRVHVVNGCGFGRFD